MKMSVVELRHFSCISLCLYHVLYKVEKPLNPGDVLPLCHPIKCHINVTTEWRPLIYIRCMVGFTKPYHDYQPYHHDNQGDIPTPPCDPTPQLPHQGSGGHCQARVTKPVPLVTVLCPQQHGTWYCHQCRAGVFGDRLDTRCVTLHGLGDSLQTQPQCQYTSYGSYLSLTCAQACPGVTWVVQSRLPARYGEGGIVSVYNWE